MYNTPPPPAGDTPTAPPSAPPLYAAAYHGEELQPLTMPPPRPDMVYATAPLLQSSEKTGLLHNETCRLCEEAVNPQAFVRPCLCERRCHRECLDRQRALDAAYLTHCPVCHFAYETEPVEETRCCTPMARFKAVVVRDMLLFMALVQGLIFLFGLAILPAADPTGVRFHWFPAGWAPLSVNYVCGVVLFFAMLGVVGLVTLLVRCCTAACTCCCQCCYDVDDDRYARSHSHYYYSNYDSSPCFIWWYPIPTPYYQPTPVASHNGCSNCACLGCGSCNCSGGGGGNQDDSTAVVVIILVLAVIGVIFSVIVCTLLLSRLYHRHAQIAARYQAAREQRVRDIGGGGPHHSSASSADMDQFV